VFDQRAWGRRALLALTLAFVLCDAAIAGAQQPRVYRVGILAEGSPPPPGTPSVLVQTLHTLGYVVGQNLGIERRWAEGRAERFPSLAADLVALTPNVIVTEGTLAALAAARATAAIPIVLVGVGDPVGSGLVASLARPGGNVTGVAEFGVETAGKLVEIAHVLVPKAQRIAVLRSDNPVHPLALKMIQVAAEKSGLTVLPAMAKSPEDIDGAFVSMTKQTPGALIVLGGPPFSNLEQSNKIISFAATNRLPAVYPGRLWVERGGLMSYGSNYLHRWKMAAAYVDKILKGARPSDLPIQQPTEFQLVINRTTATALGITIPQELLARADHVIE